MNVKYLGVDIANAYVSGIRMSSGRVDAAGGHSNSAYIRIGMGPDPVEQAGRGNLV